MCFIVGACQEVNTRVLQSIIRAKLIEAEKEIKKSTGFLEKRGKMIDTTTTGYCGFGCALAIVISYTANKSILWAILHGLLSWLYVIYAAITY